MTPGSAPAAGSPPGTTASAVGAPSPRPARASAARRRREWIKHAVILGILALELFPMYMALTISVKDNAQFLANPWLPARPADWHLSNFTHALRLLGPYVANSVFVSVSVTLGSLTLSVLGAYFFARYRMPGSRVLFAMFMVLLMMPGVINLVPLFVLLKGMSLLNTLWALVLVGVAGAQAFQVYLLRNFIEEIPRELFEAAEMDGASHLRQVWHIVLPMSLPIIGTLAVLCFLGTWNDFLLALVVLRDRELFTVGVGLVYLDGEYVKRWGPIMAAFLVAAAPLFLMFLFTMRWFVRGLSAGAVKG